MQYTQFALVDFLEDSYFKRWTYNPCPETIRFWEEFKLCYPEKLEIIEQAQSLLLIISDDMIQNHPEESQIVNMWENIQHGIDTSGRWQLWRNSTIISTAAAAIILITLTWVFKFSGYKQNDALTTYNALTENAASDLIERVNDSESALKIQLPDNSQVILKPHSKISYPSDFHQSDIREVYLSGEAFFHVSKNIQKPFYVYTKELITKVLGTSFTIKAFENSSEMEVEVKTGKVSVFQRDELVKDIANLKELDTGTILTPNQKVKYFIEIKSIKKLIVDKPEAIISSINQAPINNFEDTEVAKIFDNLKASYGIDIEYDNKLFGDCMLTASFTNETLFEKVDLICKGIEANYAIQNAKIIITGRGCH